jgi:hypothetical protein
MLKYLSQFQEFSLDKFLAGKRIVFVKAIQWDERDADGNIVKMEGSKVLVQIIEDKTEYASNGDMDNFGAQFTVKVRGTAPSAYQKLRPLQTEVILTDIERAVVWGDYRNEISVIAVVKVKGAKDEA